MPFNPYFWKEPIRHRHLVTFLLFLVLIFQSIVIGGGSSSTSKGLYILQFQYKPIASNYKLWTGLGGTPLANESGIVNQNAFSALAGYTGSTTTTVRMGYFGVCISDDNGTSNSNNNNKNNSSSITWMCGTNVTGYAKALTDTQDPLNLLYMANKVRTVGFAPWVLVLAQCTTLFTGGALIVTHDAESSRFLIVCGLCLLSFLLVLIGMVWQQTSMNSVKVTINAFSETTIKATEGTAVAGLGWTSTIFLLLCTLMLCHMLFIRGEGVLFPGVGGGGGSPFGMDSSRGGSPPLPVIPPGHGAVNEAEGLMEKVMEKAIEHELH